MMSLMLKSGSTEASCEHYNAESIVTSESGTAIDLTAKAVSLPSSPVSVTLSNDDDSDQSSIVPLVPKVTDRAVCTGGNDTKRKSVRFHDVVTVSVNKDYSDKVHEFRTDIWYTRDEYRTFWNDRVNSIRLWKYIYDDSNVRFNGALGKYCDFQWDGVDYTVRGLENYIFSSSEETRRQRDSYTAAVLRDPYNANSTSAHVCDLSRVSLQRAHKNAQHDVVDSYTGRDCAAAIMSPASIPHMNIMNRRKRTHSIFCSATEMNKQLIAQHLSDNANLNSSRVQKQQAKEGSHIQRRHSTSGLSKDCRQPVSLQMHSVSRIDQQRRRLSMSDDFSQHMQFCNRLLNDLPIINHSLSVHHRDSLNLSGSMMNQIPDQTQSTSQSFVGNSHGGNTNVKSIDDEYVLQQQMRRDSLFGSRKRLYAGIGIERNARPEPDLLMSGIKLPQQDVIVGEFHDYTNYIRSYSRLRRDSLGRNFGL